MIYTFWEGQMPSYIKLCMDTWKFPYTVINYANLKEYTDFDIENAKRFSLPQIADCVRVHVLRDQGGVWLDADTVMITDKLPTENMIGDPSTCMNSIGYLRADGAFLMFVDWARWQDKIIADPTSTHHWSVMGNMFTDPYVKEHPEISIANIKPHWAETAIIGGGAPRWKKYQTLYFELGYHLAGLPKTDFLMLHNSWTPSWYKALSEKEVLGAGCTLSNVLKELL